MIYLFILGIVGLIIGSYILFASYNNNGKALGIIIASFLLLVALAIIKSDRDTKEKCAKILSMARTNSDSIKVLIDCGKSDDTFVYVNTYTPR